MTLKNDNRWAAAGAIGAMSAIIYSPLVFRLTNYLFGGFRGVNWIAKKGCSTYAGVFLHAVVLFFIAYGFLSINWACDC